MPTKTLPKHQREDLDFIANKIKSMRTIRETHREQIRQAIGFLANEWEGITESGILVKNTPGVHPPANLGIPFTPSVLQKCYPELEVR